MFFLKNFSCYNDLQMFTTLDVLCDFARFAARPTVTPDKPTLAVFGKNVQTRRWVFAPSARCFFSHVQARKSRFWRRRAVAAEFMCTWEFYRRSVRENASLNVR